MALHCPDPPPGTIWAMRRTILTALVFGCLLPLPARAGKEHVELGAVEWLRDRDAAFERAKAEKKPIVLLFQEVPG